MSIEFDIERVKLAKAVKVYWDDVKRYGSEGHALRALDCISRIEAINMLAKVQKVSIFKREGATIIQ